MLVVKTAGLPHGPVTDAEASAGTVVYPRSREVLSWQAAGFQASGSSYRGIRDAVAWLKKMIHQIIKWFVNYLVD